MNNYYGIAAICLEINGFLTRRGECFQTHFVPSLSLFSENASEALSLLIQNKLRICLPKKLDKTFLLKQDYLR